MSFFNDVFCGPHLFDNDYRQRSDIEDLRQEMAGVPDYGPTIGELQGRVERLELLCETLVEMLLLKGMATRGELSTLMKQIDLLDGVEDGARRKEVWHEAPRCGNCERFVNPNRKYCVYCGAPVDPSPYPRADVGEVQMVRCTECSEAVPAVDTFITGSGVMCSACYFGDTASD